MTGFDSYDHLSKVLRSTVLRGTNLATNLEFHYGLVNWFIGNNVMAKPTTRFVVPYLTLVGKLKEEAQKLDVVFAFLAMKKHYGKVYADDAETIKSRDFGDARPQGDPADPADGDPAEPIRICFPAG